ncbi:Crp/Fnr family transcriptional regulator [Altericista sp. CCNU0014]|uniref:Crp/Fnr family transcriptional regulator n=1 Tax=Altericista sp. CCNU0014 TaxID=3082949 RepID=UPI00384EB4DF
MEKDKYSIVLVTPEQLQQISIFSDLDCERLVCLQPHAATKSYLRGEVILHEGDRLPLKLFAVLTGAIQVKKTASTGKETILRSLSMGEIFAIPSLFGDGISPATVVAEDACQILTVDRNALLEMLQKEPELGLRMIGILTERLQHLHTIVHGMASERAIVRLAQLIQMTATEQGTDRTEKGSSLKARLSYYHIARSIGITYEECVRLFKQLQSVVSYRRGGQILVLDRDGLEAIAQGEYDI